MKNVFTIINLCLVAAAAYFCVDVIYKNALPEQFVLSDEGFSVKLSKKINPLQIKAVSNRSRHDVIVERNLFKVEIEKKEASPVQEDTGDTEPEKLETTNLKLVLWGTVTGDVEVYAVIEDKKIRRQSLYQVGDSIQDATIKKILRHEVILTYHGKDQVLEMAADKKKMAKSAMPVRKTNFHPVSVQKALIEEARDNIGAIMRQIKFRPHFTEGESDGLMVYGIRPNSVFRKMGLRNGDIIKDINGTSIVSAEDASSFFTQMEEAEDAKVTLFRRGKIKELVYQVND